jgi:modulator of FtsH protease HflC
MKRFLLVFVLPILLLVWGRTAFYAVDYAEFAYVTRFGDPVGIKDGATDAGLHLKLPWPIDSVLRVDRRLQSFDLPAAESLTRDPATGTVDKTLTVDAFLTWRVPDAAAADRFVRSVGTPEQVKKVLSPQITGRLASIVSGMSLDQLIAVAPEAEADKRSAELQQKLLADGLQDKLRQEYGIEVVTLRVRRLSYPEAVRTSIYERIRSERGRKVAEYENQGRKESSDILSKADQERRKIEADAKAKKQLIEGQADVDADRLRNEAHAKDPEFYAFLQRLKAMQAVLADTRDVLLLSLNHDLFKLLREPQKNGGGK